MLTLLITILLSLGTIGSAAEYENASQDQKAEYLEIIGDSLHE